MGPRIQYLYTLFDEFNEEVFDNQLLTIPILLKRNTTKDGWYEYRSHRDWTPVRSDLPRASIAISDFCFEEDSVEGTLLHEMIHQWQCEVLNEAPHHNKTFNDFARKLEKKYKFDIL